MAYSPVTVDASTQTFANLQSKGFHGILNGVIAAQSPAANARATYFANALITPGQAILPLDAATNAVDAYLHGDPVSIAAVEQVLVDIQYAFGLVAQTLQEVGTLVDANQGTLKGVASTVTGGTRRIFP